MDKVAQEVVKKMPKLGFGAMRLPTLASGKIDIPHVNKMVDAYIEAGLNYFDTAYMYHGGESELAIKECVVKRYPRESFIVVDKLPAWEMQKAGDAEKLFNEQLTRCGVDYFDIYLLHALNGHNTKVHEDLGGFDYCLKMKEEGKIKCFGFSFHGSLEDLRYILTNHPELEIVMLQLNYFDWELGFAKDCYDIVKELRPDMPIVTMEPVRGGALVKGMPESAASVLNQADPNVSLASWAVRWCASLDGVVTVLSGMSNLEQVVDNIKTFEAYKPLTDSDHEAIVKAAKVLTKLPTSGCTACNYCDKCPQDIPIADILLMHDKYLGNRSSFELRGAHDKIDKDKNAASCIDCGICLPLCPQSIAIPDKLREVVEALA